MDKKKLEQTFYLVFSKENEDLFRQGINADLSPWAFKFYAFLKVECTSGQELSINELMKRLKVSKYLISKAICELVGKEMLFQWRLTSGCGESKSVWRLFTAPYTGRKLRRYGDFGESTLPVWLWALPLDKGTSRAYFGDSDNIYFNLKHEVAVSKLSKSSLEVYEWLNSNPRPYEHSLTQMEAKFGLLRVVDTFFEMKVLRRELDIGVIYEEDYIGRKNIEKSH